LVFAPDGKTLIGADNRGAVTIWDAATAKAITSWQGGSKRIRALAVAPDGQSIATAGDDDTVKLWALPADPNK
jgi:WD40 repeat protein